MCVTCVKTNRVPVCAIARVHEVFVLLFFVVVAVVERERERERERANVDTQ